MMFKNICAFLLLLPALFGCRQNTPAEVAVEHDTWKSVNLFTVVYSNGDSIPKIEDAEQWLKADYGAYCNYYNSNDSIEIYGRLYNWYAVNDKRGLCPAGWHIPSKEEWERLSNYFGGDPDAGKHLKGSRLWLPGDHEGDNSSRLNFVPGGNRKADGTYNGKGSSAPLWTSDDLDSLNAWGRFLNKNHYHLGIKSGDKRNGLGCRCIQNVRN